MKKKIFLGFFVLAGLVLSMQERESRDYVAFGLMAPAAISIGPATTLSSAQPALDDEIIFSPTRLTGYAAALRK